MRPPDASLWKRIPGWTGDDGEESEDEGEKDLRARSKKSLEEVAGVLGDRWLNAPCVDFSPVPLDYTGTKAPRIPPSKWNAGPPLSFRMEHVRAPVVRDTLRTNGLEETSGKEWLVMWSGPRMRDKEYQNLHELQRVNHFPGSTELTRKDRLCVHFEKMAKRHGDVAFDFLPKTYVLPKDVDTFMDVYENNKNYLWIVKPNAASQGKGIYLLRDLNELPNGENEVSVVSRYIHNPLLIQGLKFDLRVYVLVTSFEPLRAYMFREGLTRFATELYSTKKEHLKDAYRHLTNYSINKKGSFIENQDAAQDNVGHKWSFSALNRHLAHIGVDVELMWSRIMDMCIKTLISVKPNISAETRRATAHSCNCFELYGFDVLVDEHLKPWLLEVNLSPSMLADSPLDMQVKGAALSDTFNLIGVSSASWRTLATAKLRSQVQQMRHASVLAGQAAAAALNGGHWDFGESETDQLDKLSERELKMMAQALKESGMRSNFIRLYPTASSVTRYAPLMRAPSPGERLLYSMLLGEENVPTFPSPRVPQLKSSRRAVEDVSQRRDANDGKRGDDPIEDYQTMQTMANEVMTACKPTGFGTTTVDWDKEQRPPGGLQNSMDVAKEEFETNEMGDDNLEPEEVFDWSCVQFSLEHDPSRAALAKQVLKRLGTRTSARVVFMEYLIRFLRICPELSANGLQKIAQSKAYKRLVGFRQQMAIFLSSANAGKKLADDMDSDFTDHLVASCRASLACAARDLWEAASAAGASPSNAEGGELPANLHAHLPPGFAKSSRGEKIVEAVQGLSCSDLEYILQGPQSVPEFASILGSSGSKASQGIGGFISNGGGFEDLERAIAGCSDTSGPLSELLRAVRPSVSQRKEERQPPPPPKAALPAIVPRMAHGTAAYPPQREFPKTTLRSADLGSSAAMLKTPDRLDAMESPAYGLQSFLPKPPPRSRPLAPTSPVVPRGTPSRTQSLPALRQAPTPTTKSLPSLAPSLASLRPKQLQWPVKLAAGDFMNMDIEF